MNPHAAYPDTVSDFDLLNARAQFISRTYNHLMLALFAFAGLLALIFRSGAAEPIARALLSVHWGLVLGGMMLISWIATRFADGSASRSGQYAGLGLYVAGQALLFTPLLFLAENMIPGVTRKAALVSLAGFGLLSGIAHITRKDFSFLKGVLMWGGLAALALIGISLFSSLQLGHWFSIGMVFFAGAAILYDTSNVIHHYPTDRHVGAALQLFASVVLLFWYVIRLFMSRHD